MTCLRGLVATGRPPRLTVLRASMSSVSCGSVAYSAGLILCESMRLRSDFKVRADAGLFTFFGFPHAEDVADCTSRRVADNDEAASEMAKADDARLAAAPPRVFNFKRQSAQGKSIMREG